MECTEAIQLTTKYWEIDHGTLRSLPDSGFIENVLRDSDGIFILYCKSQNGNLYWGLRNPPENFDYTITLFGSFGKVKPVLNSSVNLSIENLFHWKNMHCFVNQKLKVAYNFFFYQKLGFQQSQKLRDFVQQKFNYVKEEVSVTPKCTISTIQIPTTSLTITPSFVTSEVATSESTLPTQILPPSEINLLPFKSDIVFYVDSLNPSLPLTFSSKLITPTDMIKVYKLPDGTSATICNMKYFTEESAKFFNFDMEALKLYLRFKSITDHQICTACPKKFEIDKCNIWQMNINGYYLCSTCCLSIGRSNRKHNCHVPTNIAKNRWRSKNGLGLCQRCFFYFKPYSVGIPSKERNQNKQSISKRCHVEYSATEFFQSLISETPNHSIPDFSDWQTPDVKSSASKSEVTELNTSEAKYLSAKDLEEQNVNSCSTDIDTVNDNDFVCSDIITVKDTPSEFSSKNFEIEFPKSDEKEEEETTENKTEESEVADIDSDTEKWENEFIVF